MLKKVISLFFIINFIIIFGAANISLAQKNNTNNKLEIEIKAGFENNKAPEGWMPLKIIIKNNSQNYFQGNLKLIVEKRDIFSEIKNREIRIFEKRIKIDAKTKKYINMPLLYKRNYFANPRIILSDNKDKIIIEKIFEPKVKSNYGYNILVINQAGAGYDFLEKYNNENFNSKKNVYYLSADNLPEDFLSYRELDLIILGKDNFNKINYKQITALKNWLSLDNQLLISGEGDFFSYNSQIIKELCPFQFVKKNLVQLDNSLAHIWLLKDENNNEILNNEEIPQVLKYKIGSGNVIFSALEPLSISKKEEFYFKIIPAKSTKGEVEYGFLRNYQELFLNEVSYQYSFLYYLITVFILYLILLYYIYKKLQSQRYGVKKFLLMFISFIFIFIILFYFSIGQNIVEDNNILSEVAIIEMKENSHKVFVESYLSYLSHPLTKASFYVNKEKSFLLNNDEKNTKIILKEERILFQAKNNDSWQSGYLRAYYFSDLYLEHNLFKKNNKVYLKVKNNSNLDLKHIYIYYNKNWYSINGLKIGQEHSIELFYKIKDFRGNRNRVYKDVINMNGYLTEDLINRVVDEVITYKSDIEEKVIIFGLLEGEELKNSIGFIGKGNKIFSGIFHLTLDVNNIEK